MEKKRIKKIDGLGEHSHFLTAKTITEHKADLEHIYNSITEALKIYPNFDGIDFCDVSAGGIQIRLHHKEVSGYTYADQATINYDFSNVESAILQAIEIWKAADAPEKLKFYQDFLEWGSKYGFD